VRAKDTRGKAIADPSSANFVQRGDPKFQTNQNKRKKPSQKPPKAKEADGPNKKKGKPGGACHTCGSPDHFAAKCPDRNDRKAPKTTDMVVSEGGGTTGYGNFLPTVLLVCSSPAWWIDRVLIFMNVLTFLCFLLTRLGGLTPC
jgi:hypothetical protein